MLGGLKRVAKGGNPIWYARGLVVSMTESTEDLLFAFERVRVALGEKAIPVIPLFEKQSAIEKAVPIVGGFLESPRIKKILQGAWNRKSCF